MRKIKVLFTLLCGLMLSSVCLANSAAENFRNATRYIDPNGEMYLYTNTVGIEKLVNEMLPATVKIFTQSDPQAAAIADPTVKAVLNLLNIKAFRAVAFSSVEAEKDLYISKEFVLFDRNAKSIFIDPTAKNKPLNWAALPADTRIAFRMNLNLAYIWKLVKKEVAATPWYKQFGEIIEHPELNLVLNNFHGDIELLVTGTSLNDVACFASIPDNNGHIAAAVKKAVGDQVKNNTVVIPMGPSFTITVKFMPGKIVAYTSPKLLAPPKKTLASLPRYQKMAKYLPANGTDYFVLDIPEEVIILLKAEFKKHPETVKLIDLFLKPVSIASVGVAQQDGYRTVAASNISFAQVGQVIQCGGTTFPVIAAMLLPALDSARDRARAANCLNCLKQLGTVIHIYASDNNDYLPADLKVIVQKAYLSPEVLKHLVYIGPYEKTKLGQIQNPSRYPIAICKRDGHHDGKTINVLLLDGHVETHKTTESPVLFLTRIYNLKTKDVERITRRLEETQ